MEELWYYSVGGAGPVPPDPPPGTSNSLRFRGTQLLTRTSTIEGNRRTWTWSFWVKKGFASTDSTFFWRVGDASGDGMRTDQNERIEWSGNASGTFATTGIFNDQSAWYHVVLAFDSTQADPNNRNILYINGVRQTFNSYAAPAQNAQAAVGGASTYVIGGSPLSTQQMVGYYSDNYFIDGQALLPTAFGRFNDDGVWVPREVDFTPAEMRFSDFLFTSTNTAINVNSTDRNFANGSGPEFAFDGDTQLATNTTATTNSAIVFRPTPELTGVTQVEVNYSAAVAGTVAGFNGGNETNAAAAGWNEVYDGAAVDVNNIYIRNAAQSFLAGIRITDANGTRILTNPFMWSATLRYSSGTDNGELVTNAQNAFDNSLTTSTTGEFNANMRWIPENDIEVRNSLRINVGNNMMLNFNGSNIGSAAGQQWLEYPGPFPATINATTPLTISNAGDTPRLFAIEIDGQIYVDGVNPSYGANGFHLTFEDPDDLGLDTSGNGNNFTATEFDTETNGVRTELFEEPFRNFQAAVDTTTSPIGFIPTTVPQITTTEQLLFELDSAVTTVNIVWNGGAGSANGVSLFVSPDGTADSFVQILNNASVGGTITVTNADAFRFIRIGATSDFSWGTGIQEPSGSPGPNYDAMEDGPSQNYATLNPLIGPGQAPGPQVIETERANLQAGPNQTGSDGFVNSTVFQTNQDVYVECTVEDVQNQIEVGFTPPGVRFGGGGTPFVNFFGFNQSSQVWIRDEDETRTDIALDATDQTFGFHVDVSEGDIDVYHGGNIIGTSTGWTFTEPRTFAVGSNGGSGVLTMTWNYGQQPFVQRPAALGDDTELQTQNLPEVDIANGRDHFEAVTYTGNASGGTGTQNIGLEFQPDLVWIKSIDAGYNNNLFDSVRGTSVRLRSNKDNGNDPMTDGVTAFNSNGFTVGGNAGVNDNNEPYVAWCWRAGGAAEANNDGTIESQVSANTVAGFSIVSYTGETANRTVGHGLTEPPEFMIVKRTNATVNWAVYHQSLGAGSIMSLNNNATPSTGSGFWNNTPPNDDVFSIGDSGLTGTNGPYIAYCWAPVPGYSAFGSYTGNNSTDGPFIYLGFRPAFLLVKNTSRLSAWTIKDSTRNPTNPCNLSLFPNTDQNEGTGGDVDFLSNGFKIRNTAGDFGDPGDVVVYVAFAENPFGGENIAPANAR